MSDMIVCIGRQYGSGGREIGEKLSKLLNVNYYDKLLLKRAAENSGLSEDEIINRDEKLDKFNGMVTGNVFADSVSVMNNFYLGNASVYHFERRVIEDISEKGSSVIVGRCASDIIPREKRLSIFIYASFEEKVLRVMKRNDISEKDAKLRIKRIDRMRKQYFDFYCDTEWGKSSTYDLMLSSSRFGIDGCAKIIYESIKEMKLN